MSLPWPLLDADWNHWPEAIGDAATAVVAASGGFGGLEVGVYDPAVELEPGRLGRLRIAAAVQGLTLGALLWSLPVERWPSGALTDAGQRDRLVADAAGVAEAAADLGLDVVGLWPGADPADGDRGTAAATLRALAEVTADRGVRIAVEPKPGTIVPDVRAAIGLAAETGRADVGVLLDTAHELAAGADVAAAIGAAGDRLWHVHLGDADPASGDADADLPPGSVHDFAPILRALADVGYRGALALDLYGVVSSGALSGVAATGAARAHLLDAWRRA
jgi:sugar phosphate isomerase/epimerase